MVSSGGGAMEGGVAYVDLLMHGLQADVPPGFAHAAFRIPHRHTAAATETLLLAQVTVSTASTLIMSGGISSCAAVFWGQEPV